jgi:uncharacterized protein (TIGR02996 family)
MTDGYALLRAIEADPEDDTPRLVYADWLDEQGGEVRAARAEYIRVQCELARSGLAEDRRKQLQKREAELLERFGRDWWEEHGITLRHGGYQRGFIEVVHLDAPVFCRDAERLAALAPMHHLRLVKTARVMEELAACPQLACVRILDLSHNVLRNAHIATLARSPYLSNLAGLDLMGNHIGIAGCGGLAAAPIPALRTLNFSHNPIKDRGLRALLEAAWMGGLTYLRLVGCGLDRDGIEALAGCPAAWGLRRLVLGDHARILDLRCLVSAPFSALERLALTIGAPDEVASRLAANPALTNLDTLALIGISFSDHAARAILNSPYLSKLRRLMVPEEGLTRPVLQELRERFGAGLNPSWSSGDW